MKKIGTTLEDSEGQMIEILKYAQGGVIILNDEGGPVFAIKNSAELRVFQETVSKILNIE